ncbi:hypothetical protein Tco_0346731, partial [Tanacetum coccineum]
MDSVTANKCKQGIGMVSECGVFGHTYSSCYKNVANISTNTEHVKESVKEKTNVGNTEELKESVKEKTNMQKENTGIQKESNDERFV